MVLSRMRENDERVAQQVSIGGRQVMLPAVMLVDSNGNEAPVGGTAVAASSGNVANAAAAASLAAAAGLTNYLTGIEITYTGATAAGVVLATITGLLGGTQTLVVPVPAGATAPGTPLVLRFDPPHPASAANVAITATLPALGAGNTNACVNIRGIRK